MIVNATRCVMIRASMREPGTFFKEEGGGGRWGMLGATCGAMLSGLTNNGCMLASCQG